MEKRNEICTIIGYGINNYNENLRNVIKAYEIRTVNNYNYLPIENKVVWILCHGIFFKEQVKLNCIDINSLCIKNDCIGFDIKKLQKKSYFGFAFNIKENIFILPQDLLKLLNCYNCDIIIDSCYSGYLNEYFIESLVQRKNRIFTCGTNKEINSKYSGSELNNFLLKNKDILYDNIKLNQKIKIYNEKNNGFYLALYY